MANSSVWKRGKAIQCHNSQSARNYETTYKERGWAKEKIGFTKCWKVRSSQEFEEKRDWALPIEV